MKNSFISEISISLILLVLLLLVLDIFPFWMPTGIHMLILVGIAIVFTFFGMFILRENSHDERESFHKYLAARVGFITGGAILTIGVIVESLNHKLDSWLVIALVGMVNGKITGLMYGRKKY